MSRQLPWAGAGSLPPQVSLDLQLPLLTSSQTVRSGPQRQCSRASSATLHQLASFSFTFSTSTLCWSLHLLLPTKAALISFSLSVKPLPTSLHRCSTIPGAQRETDLFSEASTIALSLFIRDAPSRSTSQRGSRVQSLAPLPPHTPSLLSPQPLFVHLGTFHPDLGSVS